MKKFISIILGASLLAAPIQSSRAQLAPAICIIVVVSAGTAAVIWIMTCGPKYYCVYDHESNHQWCRTLARGEAQSEGWTIISGPYKDAELCNTNCPVKGLTNSIASSISTTIHVEKSTNLVDWAECAAFTADPECFEWSEPMSQTLCYYRVRY